MLTFSRTKKITVLANHSRFNNEFLHSAYNVFKFSGIKHLAMKSDTLYCRGAIFRFIWNGFNFLNGISKAKIHIRSSNNEVEIRYKLFFTEVFFVCLALSIIPISYHSFSNIALIIGSVIWIVLYGGNYVVSIIRFNHFVKKTIKKSINTIS